MVKMQLLHNPHHFLITFISVRKAHVDKKNLNSNKHFYWFTRSPDTGYNENDWCSSVFYNNYTYISDFIFI